MCRCLGLIPVCCGHLRFEDGFSRPCTRCALGRPAHVTGRQLAGCGVGWNPECACCSSWLGFPCCVGVHMKSLVGRAWISCPLTACSGQPSFLLANAQRLNCRLRVALLLEPNPIVAACLLLLDALRAGCRSPLLSGSRNILALGLVGLCMCMYECWHPAWLTFPLACLRPPLARCAGLGHVRLTCF